MNKKQKLFIDLYYKYNLDNIKAYIEVYDCSYNVAKNGSWRLLNDNDSIKPYLDYKRTEFENAADVSKDWIKRKLKRYTDAYDTIMDLSEKTDLTKFDKEKLKQIKSVIKGSDISAFFNMLNKMGGFYEPEKIEIKQEWNFTFTSNNDKDDDSE